MATGGVAVVGSISADLTAYAAPLPRPGETVTGSAFSLVLGGKGANQAVAAVRAGAPTFMVGAVGDDEFRELTRGRLQAEGIDVDAVEVVDAHTGIAHIRVDASTGQNDIVVVPNANHQLTADGVRASLATIADRVGVLLLQLEIPLEAVLAAAAYGAERGWTVVLDPAPAQPLPDDVWPTVALVKPNEHEAEILTGIAVDDDASADRAGRWFIERGAGAALITLGARGARLVGVDGGMSFDAVRVRPVDTTAAGDAVAGALGAALAAGLDLPTAVRRGLAAGAYAVTVPGASPSLPTAAQIDDVLRRASGEEPASTGPA